MSNSRKNASNYIDEMYLPKIKNSGSNVTPAVLLLSIFSALFIMLIGAFPLVSGLMNKDTGGTSANAWGPLCRGSIGSGMDSRKPWADQNNNYPLKEKSGRTWTGQEAFGKNGMTLVHYHGEGKGKDFASDKATPKGANYTKYAAQYNDKLEQKRNGINCISGGIANSLAGLGLGAANMISGFAQFFATTAFDTDLICPDPANVKANSSCFNLGKIIGGTGGEKDGIIGALTASIYLPLLVIAVTITAFWIGYIGFVKRKLREALFGLIWLIASVVVGLALLLNPAILAKAPVAFANAVSTCVIGAFNGENCMDTSSTNAGIKYEEGAGTSKNLCRSNVSNASIQETMLLRTNAISCSIWKAFILEPYAQASFGMTFEDLDSNTGKIKQNIEDAGLTSEDFCINMYSTKSYESMEDKTLQFTEGNQNKICNVLVYQMFLQVDAKTGTKADNWYNSSSDDWYKVVAAAAASDSTWSAWAGGPITAMTKMGLAIIAIITSALGSFIIIVTSVFALVYYVSAVILMAFAPIFFLFGVHPGRGKRILLGWIEKIVSSLLKYLLSAVFLVTTLAIYGAVLQDMSNMGMTLLFVIIVSMALFMYRNELMGMLGKANMGGEQLSNAMSQKLGNTAKKTGRLGLAPGKVIGSTGLAAASGGIGALAATGGLKSGVPIGKRLSAAKAGVNDGAKRSLRRRGGVLGNAVAQYERSSTDNKRDLRTSQQDAQKNMLNHGDDQERNAKDLTEAQTRSKEVERDGSLVKDKLEAKTENLSEFRDAEKETTEAMATDSSIESRRQIEEIKQDNNLTPEEKETKIAAIQSEHKLVLDFANYQNLTNSIHDAKMNLAIAEKTGDVAGVQQYTEQIESLKPQQQEAYNAVQPKNIARLRHEYKAQLDDRLEDHGFANFDNDDFNAYVNLNIKAHYAQDKLNEATDAENRAVDLKKLSDAEYLRSKIEHDMYKDKLDKLRPGDAFKDSDLLAYNQAVEAKLKANNVSDEEMKILRDKANPATFDEDGNVIESNKDLIDVPEDHKIIGRYDGRDKRINSNDDELNSPGADIDPQIPTSAEPTPYHDDQDNVDAAPEFEDKPSSDPLDKPSTNLPNRPIGVSGSFPEQEERANDEAEFAESFTNNNEVSPSAPTPSAQVPTPYERVEPVPVDPMVEPTPAPVNSEPVVQSQENRGIPTGLPRTPSPVTATPSVAPYESDQAPVTNDAQRDSLPVNVDPTPVAPVQSAPAPVAPAPQAQTSVPTPVEKVDPTPVAPAQAAPTEKTQQPIERSAPKETTITPEPVAPATPQTQTSAPQAQTTAPVNETVPVEKVEPTVAPVSPAPVVNADPTPVAPAQMAPVVNQPSSNNSTNDSIEKEKERNRKERESLDRDRDSLRKQSEAQQNELRDANAELSKNTDALRDNISGLDKKLEENKKEDVKRAETESKRAEESERKNSDLRREQEKIAEQVSKGNKEAATPQRSNTGSSTASNSSEEPPMTPEEEAALPKDNKDDRIKAMNEKKNKAREERIARAQKDDQAAWDFMENQAAKEQEEVINNSRSNESKREQRKEESIISNKPNIASRFEGNNNREDEKKNNTFGLPRRPFDSGMNGNRRGRVVNPNQGKNDSNGDGGNKNNE